MSVTYPRGFQAAGVGAGLKESGRADLGLLVADGLAAAAGAFTTNRFPSAPVTVTKRHLASGRARAVVVNSGQANAGTGARGIGDAEATARSAAEILGCEEHDVLVCSTGVIAPWLPVDRIVAALPDVAGRLTGEGGDDFADAILTTDTRRKQTRVDAGPFRVGGCVKGSGMIAPRLAAHRHLATMLAFVTTDAPATPECLQQIVADRVAPVFNGVVVDGCQSTSDTVLILAGGAAGGEPIEAESADAAMLGEAIEHVCRDLARQLVADAEGATKTIVVQVEGAQDRESARRVGLAVAGSSLVKAAVFGGDPNPGRVLQAIGDAGVVLDPEAVSARLGDATIIDRGVVNEPPLEAKEALQGPEVLVWIDLGPGTESATVFGCDLSYDYVRINAEYRT